MPQAAIIRRRLLSSGSWAFLTRLLIFQRERAGAGCCIPSTEDRASARFYRGFSFPGESAKLPDNMKMVRKWWKLALAIVALLLAMQIGVSLLVRTHRMHAYLTTQLEKAFGRPVDVGHFAVQLLPTPRLDAEQITV